MIWLIFLLLLWPSLSSASVLGDLATNLAVNTWVEVPTNNIGILAQNGTDGNIISYGWNGGYDPVTKKFFYLGQDHLDRAEPYNPDDDVKFVIYDLTTNTWSLGPQPFSSYSSGTGVQQTNHSFWQNVIDTSTGTFYTRKSFDAFFYKYNIQSNTWTTTSSFASQVVSAGLVGADFFPGRGLVVAQGGDVGGGRVHLYNPANDTWTLVAQNLTADTLATFQFGAYNPTYKIFIFGAPVSGFAGCSGTTCMYKMDRTLTVTQLADAPVKFYTGQGEAGVMVADPVTGTYIYLQGDGDTAPSATRQMRTYNVNTDTWSAPFTGINAPTNLNGVTTALGTPMPDYGVIMYAFCNESTCHMFLYKYASNAANTDFANRCAARGVVICNGFDDEPDGGPLGANNALTSPPQFSGRFASGQSLCNTNLPTDQCPTIATDQAASGPSSIKFVIPSLKADDTSGFFFTNLSYDNSVQFGGNTTVYIQWRQRFDPNFLNTFYWASIPNHTNPAATVTPAANTGNGIIFTANAPVFSAGSAGQYIVSMDVPATHQGQIDPNTGFIDSTHVKVNIQKAFAGALTSGNWALANRQQGWKQLSFSSGDTNTTYSNACEPIDIVNQNTQQRGMGQMYHNCGLYEGFEIFTTPPGDILIQNARPSPYCTYSQWAFNNPVTSFPPTGNCIGYFPNEWMTFTVRYDIGPVTANPGCVNTLSYPCYKNSRIRLWIAREAQPSQQAIDFTLDLVDGPAENGVSTFGKVWLLPYQTNKDGTQATVVGNTWYDELIVSTQAIADPGAPPSPPPTNTPEQMTVGAGKTIRIGAGMTIRAGTH